MISSVVYTPCASQIRDGSTFDPMRSPIFQIIIAKIAVILTIFFLGDVLSQQLACICVSVGCSLQFWMTKNLGRKYLQAAWSIQTVNGQQDIWIYQANFKTPSSMQEIFWYSQVVYGAVLCVAAVIITGMGKYSLVCSIIIAIAANYVNFYAFSKIITLRNQGVLQKIASQARAEGQCRETIRLPMIHRSQISGSQVFFNSRIAQM